MDSVNSSSRVAMLCRSPLETVHVTLGSLPVMGVGLPSESELSRGSLGKLRVTLLLLSIPRPVWE